MMSGRDADTALLGSLKRSRDAVILVAARLGDGAARLIDNKIIVELV